MTQMNLTLIGESQDAHALYTYEIAKSLLPPRMFMQERQVIPLLFATAAHESQMFFRTQHGNPMLARGLWQFEYIGVRGVLEHPDARGFCEELGVLPAASVVHKLLAFHDVLALGIARINYWMNPKPLPPVSLEPTFQYYQETWKPGNPRQEDWEVAFSYGVRMEELYRGLKP